MTLSTTDRVIIGLLLAFVAFNLTVDLYLVVHAGKLGDGASGDASTALWAIYAPADRFWIVGPWSLAQEAVNVFFTTVVDAWLIWAIVKRRPYRHALQLALGSYLSYSVVLYYLAGHLSGYQGMPERTAYAFALFYGASLPWLLAHLFMAYDSAVAVTKRFIGAPVPPGR